MPQTHMVKTIPPLSIKRASRGKAPDQKVKIPSSLKIFAAHTKLFLYSLLASIDCILQKVQHETFTWWLMRTYLVLMVSNGWVTYLAGN